MELRGFAAGDVFLETDRDIVFRAVRVSDGLNVLIKSLRNEFPTRREIAGYAHEFSICRDLSGVPGVLNVLDLIESEKNVYLVFNDFNGLPLSKAMREYRPDVSAFIRWAVKCAQAVGALHSRRIIHKNITADTVLAGCGYEDAVLSGFDIAQYLQGETKGFEDMFLEGDIRYISPEQTGRMNRLVDYRTDFYSLGVVFYEVLTGRLPFVSNDPLETIHSHIARQPEDLTAFNPSLLPELSAVVMKLLAKDADGRYQSAWGLEQDLLQCLRMFEDGRSHADFCPGMSDIPERLNIPQKLYGRQQEMSHLEEVFESVYAGGNAAAVISGMPGTGKSFFVHEMYKHIAGRNGFFIESRCEQSKVDIPYAAVSAALRSLARLLLAQSTDALDRWRERIFEAVGPNGGLVNALVPEFSMVIGDIPMPPALGPAESRNRFTILAQNFLKLFSSQGSPLVLFIDDAQWADPSSVSLIESVLTDLETESFMLVFTYRENDIDESHYLSRSIEQIHSAHVPVSRIILHPLDLGDILSMVRDLFQKSGMSPDPLAGVIYDKTGGNQFFVLQLIRKITDEGLVFFSRDSGAWEWNIADISRLDISDNVIDLLSSRIRALPEGVKNILCIASCVGSRFDLKILSAVSGLSIQELFADLLPAVSEGLIVPLGDAYKYRNADTAPDDLVYVFLHDRVQEAARTFISEKESLQFHFAAGRHLYATHGTADTGDLLFALASHFINASVLVKTDEDRLHAAEVCLAAGKKAKRSAAYSQAVSFLTAGIGFFAEDAWKTNYVLIFTMNRELSECLYLAGEHDRAEKLYDMLVERAESFIDKAEIYNIRIVLYANIGKFVRNNEVGIEALKLFGMLIPDINDKAALEEEIRGELVLYTSLIEGVDVKDLASYRRTTDQADQMRMRLLMNIASSAYVSNQTLLVLLALKMVNFTMQRGIADSTPFGFMVWGLVCGSRLRDYRKGFEFAQCALAMNERIGNVALSTNLPFMMGNFINHWTCHVRTNLPYLYRAFDSSMVIGDFVFGCFAANAIVRVLLSYGHDSLESTLAEIDRTIPYLRKVKNAAALERQELVRHVVLNLLGKIGTGAILSSDSFDERIHLEKMKKIQYGTGIALYLYYRMMVLYIRDQFNEASAVGNEVLAYLPFISNSMQEADAVFFCAMAAAASGDGSEEMKRQCIEKIEPLMQQLERWMSVSPDNFTCKYFAVKAEYSRIIGDASAGELYDAAIHAAEANEFIFISALINEVTARYYIGRGRTKMGRAYLLESLYYYTRWGAHAKVQIIKDTYQKTVLANHSVHEETGRRREDKAGLLFARSDEAKYLDLMSVMKSTQAISGEIELDRLISRMMEIVTESAGAQRVSLIIMREGSFIVAAKSVMDGVIRTELCSIPVDDDVDLPSSVINYVRRTRETVVLGEPSSEGIFTADPYIARHKPGSILCIPIVEHAHTSGLLYCENTSLKNAFTAGRVTVLEIIASQAAVSLRNALNYESLRLAKNEIRDNEQRFRMIFNSVNDAIFVHDRMDGSIVDINDRACEMYGYSHDELRSLDVGRISSGVPPFTEEDAAVWLRKAAEGIPQLFEWRAKRKDGSLFWGEVNMRYTRIMGQERILVVVRNIEERKQSAELERRNVQYLESMDRISRVIAQTLDMDGVVRNVLSLMSEIFHSERSWLVFPCDPASSSWKIIYEQGSEKKSEPAVSTDSVLMDDAARRIFTEALASVEPVCSSEQGDRLRGAASENIVKAQMHIAVRPRRGKPWLLGIHHCRQSREWTADERKLFADIALRLTDALTNLLLYSELSKSEEEYRALFMNMQDLFYRSDKNGIITHMSPSVKMIMGYNLNEVIGAPLAETLYIDPNDRDVFLEKLRENGGSVEAYEVRLRRKDGSVGYFETYSHYYYDDNGNIGGVEGTVRDVSARKIAEEQVIRLNAELEQRVSDRTCELEAANRELKNTLEDLKRTQNQLIQTEKMAALGNLVAGIAHEINTPVGVGLTAVSYLEQRMAEFKSSYESGELRRSDLKSLLDTGVESSRMVLANLRRASELINGFKQVAVDQSSEEKRKFEMREYIDDILLSLTPRIRKSKVHVECQVPAGYEIVSYPGAISQILTNFIINSLMHAYGPDDKGVIRIEVSSAPGECLLVYSDDGKGIDEFHRRKIFEPFFTTRRSEGGSGLGLHIVYNIVTQQLGGTIEAESVMGHGALFRVRFPV